MRRAFKIFHRADDRYCSKIKEKRKNYGKIGMLSELAAGKIQELPVITKRSFPNEQF